MRQDTVLIPFIENLSYEFPSMEMKPVYADGSKWRFTDKNVGVEFEIERQYHSRKVKIVGRDNLFTYPCRWKIRSTTYTSLTPEDTVSKINTFLDKVSAIRTEMNEYLTEKEAEKKDLVEKHRPTKTLLCDIANDLGYDVSNKMENEPSPFIYIYTDPLDTPHRKVSQLKYNANTFQAVIHIQTVGDVPLEAFKRLQQEVIK